MSDVANCESSQCSCRKCQDLPSTPGQATDVPGFDFEDVCSMLEKAHGLIWEDEDPGDLSTQLELNFRTYNPDNGFHDVVHYHRPQGQWMRYRCDLTGMWIAVRKGAPIPVIAIHETLDTNRKSLAQCFKIHPDFLNDREYLLEMIASKLEDCVIEGLFQARQALSCFRFMNGRSSLPGVQTGGISYPQGYGYKALGDRPIHE